MQAALEFLFNLAREQTIKVPQQTLDMQLSNFCMSALTPEWNNTMRERKRQFSILRYLVRHLSENVQGLGDNGYPLNTFFFLFSSMERAG